MSEELQSNKTPLYKEHVEDSFRLVFRWDRTAILIEGHGLGPARRSGASVGGQDERRETGELSRLSRIQLIKRDAVLVIS